MGERRLTQGNKAINYAVKYGYLGDEGREERCEENRYHETEIHVQKVTHITTKTL